MDVAPESGGRAIVWLGRTSTPHTHTHACTAQVVPSTPARQVQFVPRAPASPHLHHRLVIFGWAGSDPEVQFLRGAARCPTGLRPGGANFPSGRGSRPFIGRLARHLSVGLPWLSTVVVCHSRHRGRLCRPKTGGGPHPHLQIDVQTEVIPSHVQPDRNFALGPASCSCSLGAHRQDSWARL